MNIFMLVLLCVIQGLTEFLPVSSSGHLLLVEKLFGVESSVLAINLFLHLATLLAVVIEYRKTIFKIIKKPFQQLTYKLILTTTITVCFSLIYKVCDIEMFANKFFGLFFIFTALILYFNELFYKKSAIVPTNEISYKSAIVVGIVQGFAVLPGLSRSGSTISALNFMGNDSETSAEYSFLMSIPIIIGGFILELISLDTGSNIFGNLTIFQYLFSFLLTFFVSIISLKATIKLLKKNKFIYFAIYLLVVGIVSLIISFA